MKKAFILLAATFAFGAFAQQDATPSDKTARKAAGMRAYGIMSDVLDDKSSLNLLKKSESAATYTYLAIADDGANLCAVEVKVSKETGLAFADEDRVCEVKSNVGRLLKK